VVRLWTCGFVVAELCSLKNAGNNANFLLIAGKCAMKRMMLIWTPVSGFTVAGCFVDPNKTINLPVYLALALVLGGLKSGPYRRS
jgi:hypothetical protein